MLRIRTKRACLALLLACALASCSDDDGDDDDLASAPADGGDAAPWPDANKDAGKDASVAPNIDAAVDAAVGVDATVVVDAGNKALVACLDRPGLATPPKGELPCELLPPGLSLAR